MFFFCALCIQYLLRIANQPRFYSRSDYCVAAAKWAFPYVYGYTIYEALYGKDKYEQVLDMVDTVVNSGVKVLLNSNTFMDATSRTATNKKIAKLRTFIGFPPPIIDYETLASYYSTVVIIYNYMENLEQVAGGRAISQQLLYNGETVNMTGSWPSGFSDPNSFGYWFVYLFVCSFLNKRSKVIILLNSVPTGNYFTIPVLITQKPFFDVSYPSSINFGGIGAVELFFCFFVIGHEMSHGYDPNVRRAKPSLCVFISNYFGGLKSIFCLFYKGHHVNGDGKYVNTSIWTASTKAEYDDRVQCLIDQYDTLEIANGVYVDGNRTKTENVADNSGSAASWLAWQAWKQNVVDPVLPGVNLTSEQLFFLGWARSWCEVTVSSYYVGWRDVHAPNEARVWGVVQNSQHFADAYKCAANTFMNPTSKCQLWS
ncbi:hypothetical protein RFI_24007 [Reticulomyxa filosa]|uniref:Peptidase M13 C-terminal domain-containing protein n=1 Tax=Reticulomyxa filosa TaxID=46433 RepID=X6MK14_RETFI|nr:hypothetical protein RFI_24007 [Reticulomyxa filosa]|eukprot:ETO13370.1 hypothetical protein RFI_24007 [Reticulomyxa filosa]